MNTTELVTIRGGSALATTGTTAVADLAGRWLVQFRNVNTQGAYARDLRDYLAWCESREVDPLRVDRALVDLYQGDLSADLAASTIARRLASLHSFFEYALDMKLLTVNPVGRVKRPKCGPDHVKLTGSLTPSEIAAMINAHTNTQDRALCLLLGTTGVRISEALQLTTDSIGTERGHTIVSLIGKGGKVINVPLVPVVADALTELGQVRGHGPLFINTLGQPLDRHGAARILSRLAHRAGLKKVVTPHMLRSAAITNALQRGTDLHRVQAMVGHSDPKTTLRYFRAADSLDQHPAYDLGADLVKALAADTAATD